MKLSQLNKFKNQFNLIKNSSILSMPSVLGIFLALVAIPIHLEINGKNDYGNYIFFHFIFSFGLLLNFGINKITTIELSKNKNKYLVIKEGLFYSLIVIFLLLIITILSNYFFKDFFYLLIIFLGISLTIFYLTLEGILQGFKRFQLLSFANFIFYTVSLNLPSIILLIKKEYDFIYLITLSILIKSVSVFLIIFIIRNYIFKQFKGSYNFLIKIKKYSKWYFLHMTNLQIYDFVDKYLIKLFLGPTALAIYSIPYQIAGKITILSKSISAVLLPDISHGKNKENFSYSINLYSLFIPIILLGIFPILNELLNLWLKNENSKEILDLSKIFLISSWLSGISHIMIAYFEGKENIRYNTKLEIIFVIPFLIFLFAVLFKFKSLIIVGFVILLKELILVLLRSNKLKSKIKNTKLIYTYIFFVIFCLIIDMYYNKYFLYFYLSIIILSLSYFIYSKKK